MKNASNPASVKPADPKPLIRLAGFANRSIGSIVIGLALPYLVWVSLVTTDSSSAEAWQRSVAITNQFGFWLFAPACFGMLGHVIQLIGSGSQAHPKLRLVWSSLHWLALSSAAAMIAGSKLLVP